jgi:hypothetical protein
MKRPGSNAGPEKGEEEEGVSDYGLLLDVLFAGNAARVAVSVCV